jgi:hypothetical protein
MPHKVDQGARARPENEHRTARPGIVAMSQLQGLKVHDPADYNI